VSIAPYTNLDLHPNGSRFLVLSVADTPENRWSSVHATFLLNFIDELRRRLPPGAN